MSGAERSREMYVVGPPFRHQGGLIGPDRHWFGTARPLVCHSFTKVPRGVNETNLAPGRGITRPLLPGQHKPRQLSCTQTRFLPRPRPRPATPTHECPVNERSKG